MSRKSAPQESGPSVPAYIVTFSDMVTLLLTFFVLLISLANMQDPDKFNQGRDAFVRHINTMGLGMLIGKNMTPDFSEVKVKYRINNDNDDMVVRTIDSRGENLRRIFSQVNRSMETKRSQIVSQRTNFSVTNIIFSPGDAQLNESAKKFLTQFAANLLQADTRSKQVKLYVLGLAPDEQTEKEQWILSSKRAQAVADFLCGILPIHLQSGIYSWGAGPGGQWTARDDIATEQTQILIAVLNK